MFRWSYGHDSKCATFSWSRGMFYMLRMYVYDTRKIFYWLSKSKSSPKKHTEGLPKSRIFCHFCVVFWRRLWLQKPVDKFLCVVSIRWEHVKHFPRLEKCSAHWIRTVRLTKHFLLKEKWLSSEFFEIQVSEALPNLPPCASFWRRLWIQKPV